MHHRILLPAVCCVATLGAVVLARHERAQTTATARAGSAPTRQEIIVEFTKASTGNVADAVDEATGQRGFMYRDMKPVFKTKIMGPATTAVLRRVLKGDQRDYPNRQLEILDESASGSVLVYVLEDGLETAGIGNLMATTGKVRGLAGAVIDGGARDVEELEEIGFPVFSRSLTPSTSVGRYVSVTKNVPVTCAGVLGATRGLDRGRSHRSGRSAGGQDVRCVDAAPAVRREGNQDGVDHQRRKIDAESARQIQPILIGALHRSTVWAAC